MKPLKLFLTVLVVASLAGCSKKGCTDENATNYDSKAKKDDGSCIMPTPDPTVLELEFENVINSTPVAFNTTEYVNANLDTFTLSALRYIVSNIKLYNGTQLVYTEPESYHLIDQADAGSLNLELINVPVGSYDKVQFSIGVDSTNNKGSVTKGDLHAGNGMYWVAWDDYRFLVFEAMHLDHDTTVGPVVLHVGGNSNYKTMDLSTGAMNIEIVESKTTMIHIQAEIANVLTTPNTIDFSVTNNVRDETSTKIIADNYETGVWGIHHIHNP